MGWNTVKRDRVRLASSITPPAASWWFSSTVEEFTPQTWKPPLLFAVARAIAAAKTTDDCSIVMQQIRIAGDSMLHKFHVGETVTVSPSRNRNVPGGACVVTKHLPDNDDEPEYRIRSANEPYERVARESELTKA
jgi:hypothetical protein